MNNFVIQDLQKEYNFNLLYRFYHELIVPNFPIEDELESLENWQYMLSNPVNEPNTPIFHVLLAFDLQDTMRQNILGGRTCEYYRRCNCGLLTYIAIHPQHRQKGLGRYLVNKGLEILDADAKSMGHKSPLAIFVEINSPNKVEESQDVISPTTRLKILAHLGCQKLDFDYIQPPLSPNQKPCQNLILGIYPSAGIVNLNGSLYLPSQILKDFLHEFYSCLCEFDFTQESYYQNMIQSLENRAYISILPLI